MKSRGDRRRTSISSSNQQVDRRFHWAGSYDGSYARHRIIQGGLRDLGYDITETRDQTVLVLRWIRMCVALLRIPRTVPLVIGESSNYLAPVMALARLQGRQVTFDNFVSLGEIHRDHHHGLAGHLWGSVGAFLDRLNCSLANTVIVDSYQQRADLRVRLQIPESKVHVVHVGVETEIFLLRSPDDSTSGEGVRVLFYGSFLPLHGIETILGAAALLKDTPSIAFTLIGSGSEHERMRELCHSLALKNVRFGPLSVPYEVLPDLIAAADICLGIFGDTPQARRVIPNKVFQAAACGRPVITADTPGIREVFTPESAVLVPAADEEALADAIRALARDSSSRHRIGARGARVVRERFGPMQIANQFLMSQAGR